MKRSNRIAAIVSLAIGIIVLGFSPSIQSADYPTRSMELIVAFSAGGSSSMGARVIAQAASEALGKPIIIVNKTGAGGSIAGTYVARAKPDGYTLLVFNSATNGISPVIRPDITYKNSDFELIGQFGQQTPIITMRADAPWKDAREVIEYAKKNPGVLKCGNTGAGSTSQFTFELFKHEAGGLQIDSVPFKGGAESSSALLGGHIHLGVAHTADYKGLYAAGKVRVVGLASRERDPDFPGAPTFTEQGLPGVYIFSWYGIAVPAGVSPEILAKLRGTFANIIKNREVTGMLKHLGFTPVFRDAENFAKFVKEMQDMYIRVGKAAGIVVK
ncbi:MAG: tripartite tricarboxylate transporter substrate binding protein [Deltaproteobacteria bacterium]|nr:tripartite tricarboxylate transporter substrate binding protein [Deltaproteobacteria bacterium]